LAYFRRRQKKPPPIIGATCAFDAKIYKNVGCFFGVSSGLTGNKNFFQISDFCFQLPSHLIENDDVSAPGGSSLRYILFELCLLITGFDGMYEHIRPSCGLLLE